MERMLQIMPLDEAAVKRTEENWKSVAKPLHSLGLLETAVSRIAGIRKNADVRIDNRQVIVMCADNGVVAEGVTQTGSEVTGIVAAGIANGTANVSRMAQTFHAQVTAVDIGMNQDAEDSRIVRKKVAYGTNNMVNGPSMSISEAKQAISAGIDLVKEYKEKGADILITGEMGIGNTTTSSAIASVFLNVPPKQVTGRGAGLSKEGMEHKITVIERAIKRNHVTCDTPALSVLASLGGYDIAGMVGLFLGGAVYRIPVVIDGFISAVAALTAVKLAPKCRDFMLASHVSKEPAGGMILNELGLKPVICGELCLGEGTGGVLLLPLLDGALSVYHSAHRFDELAIEAYQEL